MRPAIALTCSGQEGSPGSTPARDFANRAYSAAVHRAGGAPLLLPLADQPGPIRAALSGVSGVVITGGKDICPAAYGEEVLPCCGPIDPARDSLDRWVLNVVSNRQLPLLAICRGIQALAAFLGGSLYQDIGEQVEGAAAHRQREPRDAPSHDVQIAPASLLARIVKPADLTVNSFHHQAVKNVPPGFRASAQAPDGIIEGLEAEDGRFWLGVQWHPEEMAATNARHHALFEALTQAAREYASTG